MEYEITEEKILKEVSKLLKEKYHPILAKARNALAMQQLTDKQIQMTIKDNGNVIVNRHRAMLMQMIQHSNAAMDQLAKHVCKKDSGNILADLLDSLRGSDNSGLGD